jgi:hypothetical protein
MSLQCRKRDEAGPLSANIEYQLAFSLLWSSLSREKPRIAAAGFDGSLFFRCINSEIGRRLRQRGSLSNAKRDIVVCRAAGER